MALARQPVNLDIICCVKNILMNITLTLSWKMKENLSSTQQ